MFERARRGRELAAERLRAKWYGAERDERILQLWTAGKRSDEIAALIGITEAEVYNTLIHVRVR